MAENLGRGEVPNGIIGGISHIYAICAHYVNILNNEHALEPVKSLTQTLHEDFDNCITLLPTMLEK